MNADALGLVSVPTLAATYIVKFLLVVWLRWLVIVVACGARIARAARGAANARARAGLIPVWPVQVTRGSRYGIS